MECFQLLFNDCYSTSELQGSCEDGLLTLNLPESFQPSPPAHASKWNSNSMLEVLQVKVNDLHHPYGVCWWCLSQKNKVSSSQLSVWMIRQFLQALETWNENLFFSFSYVDFKLQTNYIWCLWHVRHQISHVFFTSFEKCKNSQIELCYLNFKKEMRKLVLA